MDKNSAKQNAQNMLKNKNIDGVCLNIIDETNHFGSDRNSIDLITADRQNSFDGTKLEVSLLLLDNLKEVFNESD